MMPPHYRNDSALSYKDTVDSTAAAQTHGEGHDNSSSDRSRLSHNAVAATISTEPVSEQHGPDAIRTASTGSTTSTSAHRKSRVNLACQRCKRRKQRVSDAPHRGNFNSRKSDVICASVMVHSPIADHAKRLGSHALMRRQSGLSIQVVKPCAYTAFPCHQSSAPYTLADLGTDTSVPSKNASHSWKLACRINMRITL